jgi:voltage-gated potassium channel
VDERSKRWERRFEWPVLAAALLVVPVIAIEESAVRDPWPTIAGVANWAIWIVFAAEFFTLIVVTPNRWQWLLRHPLELFIVVATPPFLPSSLQAARLFRLFRVLRLLRVLQMTRRLFSPAGVRYAALLAGLTAVGGGAAFAAVESQYSTWDGMYWAVSTMTTVGYGDVTPKSAGGRAIAMVVMVVGIGFLSLLIGAIAERFVAADVAEAEAELEVTQDDVLRDLSEITDRLQRLETSMRRLRPG